MKQYRSRRIATGDEGSLPVTLFVAVIVAGIVVTLFTVVQSGIRSSAVDRDAHQSIQVADAGVQEALVILRGVEPDVTPECEDPDGSNTPEEGRCVGVLGDDTAFEWRYEQTAPFAYDVASVGAYRNHDSAVTVQIIRPLRYEFAITTRSHFQYNGGGGGISPPIAVGTYGSASVVGTPAQDSIAGITPLQMPGESRDLDSYDISPESLATDSVQEGPDLDEDLARAACFFVDAEGEETRRPTDPSEDFYSDHDEHEDSLDGLPTTLHRGYTYCLRGEELADDYEVLEHPDGASAYEDPDNPPPAFVYIVGDEPGNPAGGLSLKSGGGQGQGGGQGSNEVNWGTEPDAGKLAIAIAKGAGDFEIAGNSKMAAGLWAPWSACVFSGTPEYRGAIVCDSVTLNGTFGYDDNVNAAEAGEVVARFWSQEAVPAWGQAVGAGG